MITWNEQSRKSIEQEKREIEQKYGIKIGKTEVHCAICGKKWDLNGLNGCKGSVAHNQVQGNFERVRRSLKRFTEASTGTGKDV